MKLVLPVLVGVVMENIFTKLRTNCKNSILNEIATNYAFDHTSAISFKLALSQFQSANPVYKSYCSLRKNRKLPTHMLYQLLNRPGGTPGPDEALRILGAAR